MVLSVTYKGLGSEADCRYLNLSISGTAEFWSESGTHSVEFHSEEGVPTGGVLAGTCFGLNLQLDSIHNSGIRLALGAFCTSPVSSLYTEANKALLEERRLQLSMHYYVRTRACIDNPAHHALHEFDQITRDLYAPMPNGRGGMTRPPAHPIGLKVEEAMTSAEINAELVCPLRTPNFPPGTHDNDPERHTLIEGVSKCMISGQEAKAKFNENRKSQGSHNEVYTDGSKMNESGGSGGHQQPFPEWRDNPPPTVLGLWWDSRLSFKKHISVLKTQCKEAFNRIRVVAHLKWGGDRDTLLMLYRAIVHSKFDYGCIAYGTASNTNLRQLDSIHNSGLRPLENYMLQGQMEEEAWPDPWPFPLVSKYRMPWPLQRSMPNWSAPWGHPTFHQERMTMIPRDMTSLKE